MDQLKDPRNRNYVIAGAGAAIAVIGFFLPFVTVTYLVNYSYSGSQVGGILWLCELLELAALAIAALFIFRPNNPFGNTNVPPATQSRWAAIGITVGGAISFLIVLLNMLNVSSQFGSLNELGSKISVSWGFGAILFLLGSAATIAGGALLLTGKTLGAANYTGPYQNNPYASGQQPQYPPQTGYPGGYPPQQQPQYPPQQQPQYPPQQPQYPPQQPTQYPPQQQPPQYPQQ